MNNNYQFNQKAKALLFTLIYLLMFKKYIFQNNLSVPPKINKESPLRNPEVVVNTTAIINCPVSGNPQPEILWYRNGVLLDASIQPRFEILASGRQLRIYETQVKDRGQYRCTARNRAGEDSADFSLDVLGKNNIN